MGPSWTIQTIIVFWVALIAGTGILMFVIGLALEMGKRFVERIFGR